LRKLTFLSSAESLFFGTFHFKYAGVVKLSRLENIYTGLRNDNETYFIFPFKKGKVTFDILFDILPQPYKLHFLQQQGAFSLLLLVSNNFCIDTYLGKDYFKLMDVLGLKYDPNNKFSSNSFFDEFNNAIPVYHKKDKVDNELSKFYNNEIEEKEKPYFDGFIKWAKESGRHVTEENLFKTRVLFPNEYNFCKLNNVSIRYTDKFKAFPDRSSIDIQ